uniref:Uncharacterized protein n=2 Tax=Octactis speculum TaxID=3111310 RepID=A0A7S2BQ78_9STRA|mmetsp:Transcript_25857/g.35579  ORF Transcript_25857/g.35579 Transcript_25857/m.35579 type:complete len:155 (+) Transcript_25857:57-521(+)
MREQLKLHKMVEMMRNAIDLDDPSAAAKLFMGAKKNAIVLLKANGVSEETADEIEAKVAELMFGDPCALLPRTVCHIKINFNDGGLQIVPGNDAHNSAPEAKKAVRATIEQAKLLQDLALRAKFAASPQEQERFLQIIKECSAQFATEVEDGEE